LTFTGIIDAGGRNATLSLQSRTGHTNLQAEVISNKHEDVMAKYGAILAQGKQKFLIFYRIYVI